MLRGLQIENYKSLKNISLAHLPNLCVLVGANAAGKSNFADALDFLATVFRSGLVPAVRIKGGYENISFKRVRRARGPLTFAVRTDFLPIRRASPLIPRVRRGMHATYNYMFSFKATAQRIAAEYKVEGEFLFARIFADGNQKLALELRRDTKGAVSFLFHPTSEEARSQDTHWFQDFVDRLSVGDDELLIPTRLADFPPFDALVSLMAACRVYQISPHAARLAGVPEKSPDLGPRGENLPTAVQYLQRTDPEAFEEFVAHVRSAVPTIEGIETKYVETKQLGLFFHELGRKWFSAEVSDGTLQTACLFLPLLDKRTRIAVIDEPENSVHPWILRHFMKTCESYSSKKQIFLTTHSVVAVNSCPLEGLYIIDRRRGISSVRRCVDVHPETREAVHSHLMQLGGIWDSGAISGVPEQQDLFEMNPSGPD